MSLKSTDVMPCWQVLLSFAHEFSKNVVVYQDVVGVMSFPAHEVDGEVHLHSLGGMHFNLMYVNREINTVNNKTVRFVESDKSLYTLVDDENETHHLKSKHDTVIRSLTSSEACGGTPSKNNSPIVTDDQIREMQKSKSELATLIKWLNTKKSNEWIL